METQCQPLTMTQNNELIKILHNSEEFIDGTLGTWNIYLVDFELKECTDPIFSRPYPVPKVHEEMFKTEVEGLVLLGFLR